MMSFHMSTTHSTHISLEYRLLSGTVHTRGGSLQDGLGDEWTCGTTLASAYVLHCLSAMGS